MATMTTTAPRTPTLDALTLASTSDKSVFTPPSTNNAPSPSPAPFPSPALEEGPTVTLHPPTRTSPTSLTITLSNPPPNLLTRNSTPAAPVFNPRIEFSHSIYGIFFDRWPVSAFRKTGGRGAHAPQFAKTVSAPRVNVEKAPKEWEGEMDVRLYAWRGEKLLGQWFVGEYIYFDGWGVKGARA